jgi:hypothetical protein
LQPTALRFFREQNPEKLMELIKEIDEILEAKQTRLNSRSSDTETPR